MHWVFIAVQNTYYEPEALPSVSLAMLHLQQGFTVVWQSWKNIMFFSLRVNNEVFYCSPYFQPLVHSLVCMFRYHRYMEGNSKKLKRVWWRHTCCVSEKVPNNLYAQRMLNMAELMFGPILNSRWDRENSVLVTVWNFLSFSRNSMLLWEIHCLFTKTHQ
jgi:hypothetical protein